MWHKIRITFFDLCLPAVKKLFPILAKKTNKNYLNLNGFVVGKRVAAYEILDKYYPLEIKHSTKNVEGMFTLYEISEFSLK
jgi:hypothetical protein